MNSHDPLCPTAGWPTQPCHCDLIARVREDELLRQQQGDPRQPWLAEKQGYAAALRDVVDVYEQNNGDFYFVLWKIKNGTLGGER